MSEWEFIKNPRVVRRFLRKRDKEICQLCQLDLRQLRYQLSLLPREERQKRLLELGLRWSQSFWDADHILPLHLGGKTEGTNLQLLCKPCHRRKSATETTERAKKRRKRP